MITTTVRMCITASNDSNGEFHYDLMDKFHMHSMFCKVVNANELPVVCNMRIKHATMDSADFANHCVENRFIPIGGIETCNGRVHRYERCERNSTDRYYV